MTLGGKALPGGDLGVEDTVISNGFIFAMQRLHMLLRDKFSRKIWRTILESIICVLCISNLCDVYI